MKILFNCLTMEKGGAERVIALLAGEFLKENDVCILTLKKSDDAYKLGFGVKRLYIDKTSYKLDGLLRKITRKMSLLRLNRMKKAIVSEKPDIIISFLPEPSLRLMLLSRLSSKIRCIPKIISIRNDPEQEFNNPLIRYAMKKLYKDVDGMVYQTEDAKNFFRRIVKTKNQIVISNPIDPSVLIKPKSDTQRKNIIISIGRLEKQKNHEMLIRAFADTLKVQKHDYCLMLYGDGSLHNYLQNLVSELGINDRVRLLGQVDNVPQVLNESKIFVLSSFHEGMPNALIEAMAIGLPCISTDCPCGGPRCLIKNECNGILVANNDSARLSDAIIRLVNNKKLRVKLSKNALGIRETNSIEVIIKKWYLCIHNATEGRR